MNQQQLISQAVATWLISQLKKDSDIMREALPPLDFPWFFKTLASDPTFDPSLHSLAMAGFDYTEIDLQVMLTTEGLAPFRGLSDDLHRAAEWRNNRSVHKSIIALASGWHPGVSTLNHFGASASRDLAVHLLHWAETQSGLTVNDRQKELLRALRAKELGSLVSLDCVSAFLAKWFSLKSEDPTGAPRNAITELGLFKDPELFSKSGPMEERLLKNYNAVQKLIDAPAAILRHIDNNIIKKFKNDLSTRDRLLATNKILSSVKIHTSPTNLASITLADALEIWSPPSDTESEPTIMPDGPAVDEPDPPTNSSIPTKGLRELSVATGEDLLDDNQEALAQRILGLEESLTKAIQENAKSVDDTIDVNGSSISVEFPIDHALIGWLNTFCSKESWGGVLYTQESSIERALKQHDTCEHWNINIKCVAKLDGKELGLRSVYQDWETHLRPKGIEIDILTDWDLFVADRSLLLDSLHYLFHFPLDWLAGHPEMALVVDRYLSTATRIYKTIQQNYRAMQDIDQGWAETGLHGLLSLDVMQIRCELEDGRHSWKAVILPTHPLHMWRYQRLASVLRGLGSLLSAEDRLAVLDECRRPEQFLSVLFIGCIPFNRGGSRLLPISSDLHGLATFENLQNVCSGLDGINAIRYAIDRYYVISRRKLTPFRIGVVNPPNASQIMLELTKILSDRRASTLPSIRLELFSTNAPAVNNRASHALDFNSTNLDMLESRFSSGRLQLQVHETARSLEEWINYWQEKPQHLLIIFDEAGVSIRRSDMGLPLPMSPFCVRKIIRYQALRGTMRLDPTTDDPPFSEFMQLLNEADMGQRDSTPTAWADAERLKEVADLILQSERPGAQWLALADRTLPSESGLTSVRLFAKREGQREILLLSRDYHRLAGLMRPAFNQWNLHVDTVHLEQLLAEGVHLVGSGLLDLVKNDSTINSNQILGLAGTLIAARDYRVRYPNSLVVSVDHQIARYWLRLGKRSERCDLLCLRKESDSFIFEGIEVKSTSGPVEDISMATIAEAQSQLEATLETVSDGLETNHENPGALRAPRCEMLKEVLVRGCLSRSMPLVHRSEWSLWLRQIFGQEGERPNISIVGRIIRVALGETHCPDEIKRCDTPFQISLQTIGELEIQHLIDTPPATSIPPVISPISSPGVILGSLDLDTDVSGVIPEPSANSDSALPVNLQHESMITLAITPHEANESMDLHPSEIAEEDNSDWPMPVNELGMIGQKEVVRQLINRLNFANDFHQRFKDTMFVGSAGVGKSSFARAIADVLFGQAPILFNGADLQKPKMIIERLEQENLIPVKVGNMVKIPPCLLFIDEVHALSHSVSTVLLSALDDQRLTTIGNIDYDFNNVVFLMATTDAGNLKEAFRTRPDRVLLRNYTLDELAGILCLHGQRELDGFCLPKEVCIEIAARARALPRVAVRMLTNQLIPHFYSLIRTDTQSPSKQLIGQAMAHGDVIQYFDEQGIDLNGLDSNAINFLKYLNQHGATSEERIRQGLGISNRNDFTEIDEYLQRLGLIVVRGGRCLTTDGRKYISSPKFYGNRISRQQ
jgi:Holliday junction resolvasome RuvABC ATP-dependent DNA helicase subunit